MRPAPRCSGGRADLQAPARPAPAAARLWLNLNHLDWMRSVSAPGRPRKSRCSHAPHSPPAAPAASHYEANRTELSSFCTVTVLNFLFCFLNVLLACTTELFFELFCFLSVLLACTKCSKFYFNSVFRLYSILILCFVYIRSESRFHPTQCHRATHRPHIVHTGSGLPFLFRKQLEWEN